MNIRPVVLLTVFLVVLLPIFLSAEEPIVYSAETEHYRVYSELSQTHATATAEKVEALAGLFNGYFHFDMDTLSTRLQIRIFSTRTRFNDYLESVISQTRDNYVYLHYGNLEKCSLLGFSDPAGKLESSFVHQAFIQFLKAFVPDPPLWLREGFAACFETARYNGESSSLTFKENLSYLETFKALLAAPDRLIPFSDMLTLDIETAREKIDVFYPEAWAMANFLLSSTDPVYSRALWDTLTTVRMRSSDNELAELLSGQVFSWLDDTQAQKDFAHYFDSRKSFNELVKDGIEHYGKAETDAAQESFRNAITLDESSYLPYYYLGLISYDTKDYPLAEFYYQTALQMGANSALLNYALGVNAYTAQRFDAAKVYLEKAKNDSSGDYRDKADELLKRLKG